MELRVHPRGLKGYCAQGYGATQEHGPLDAPNWAALPSAEEPWHSMKLLPTAFGRFSPPSVASSRRRCSAVLPSWFRGNMSVGIHGSELIVRIDPSETEAALKQPGVRIFDITGRPMKGWLLVSGESLSEKKALAAWVNHGLSYARSLPPK
jgi:hypothetical protein